MGKSFCTFSCVNSHSVLISPFFFHNVVSYLFIKPYHLFFTVKNIKMLFPSGTANEVLIIADIFLRCKKNLKLNDKS